MKVLIHHSDGSQTKLYEPGDWVVLLRGDPWFYKQGDIARVEGYDHLRKGEQPNQITFLRCRTVAHINGGWGSFWIPPWFVQLTTTPEGFK